jgi:putative ABC transport system permease protein
MTTLLAWRNLTHDRLRFCVTIIGIVFSVALMAVQSGLLLGFATTASAIVDRTGADIWVAAKRTQNVDLGSPIDADRRYQALTVPGVRAATPYVLAFSVWRRPDGGVENINLVGFDIDRGRGKPWNVVEGNIKDLRLPEAVMIDRIYAERLGVTSIGQTVEIARQRARIVGFTEGIRAFTQSPYVFMSIANARSFARMEPEAATYILVDLEHGADRGKVRREIAARLPSLDVIDAPTFSLMSQVYFLLLTGAGVALMMGAVLGLVVGLVIVAQTLYATTIDRLAEYATLRAMGATVGYLCRIVAMQAVIAAAVGYSIGISIAAVIVASAERTSASLSLPWSLAIGLGVVTLVMCLTGSLLSMARLNKINVASVFR